MTLPQFFSILVMRWKVMLGVLLATLLGTLLVNLVLPKQYTATAGVLVDVKSPDPIDGVVVPGLMAPSYMATQVDVVQSDRVAERVVKTLNLGADPQTQVQWRSETDGVGRYDRWLAELIGKSLDVKPSRESNVIAISYKSVDPKFSATMANAFAQAYMDVSLDLRTEPARSFSGYFEARAKQAREALEQAQTKLSAFQRDKGIVATDERLDVEGARLAELSSQLVAVQAISAESSSRKSQAKRADELQDVIVNPLVAGMKSDLARQEAKLQEYSQRFGERHPQVLELQANIAELRARLAQETQHIGASLGVSNDINQSREAQIRSALDAQRTKVLQLKQARDQLAVLTRDVEQAQRAYDQVQQRATQSSLEGHATQTNVAILTEADAPVKPSSPRLALNMLLALFIGTLLATGTALVLELFDRHALTGDDLPHGLGLPLLGVLPPKRRRLWLRGKQEDGRRHAAWPRDAMATAPARA